MRCNRWAWFRHSSAQFFNISFCVAFLLPILLSTFSSVFAAFYEIFHNFPLTISLNFDVFSKLQLCVTNAEQIVSVPNRESRKDRARTLTAEWKLLLPVEMGFGMRRLRHVSANFLAKLFLDGARRKGVAIENWIGSIDSLELLRTCNNVCYRGLGTPYRFVLSSPTEVAKCVEIGDHSENLIDQRYRARTS